MLIFLIPVILLHVLLIGIALFLDRFIELFLPVSKLTLKPACRRTKRKRIRNTTASTSVFVSTNSTTSSASRPTLPFSLPSIFIASLIGLKRCLYCKGMPTRCRGKKFCVTYKKNLNTGRIQLDRKKRICISKGSRKCVVRMRLGLTQR
jgi:hypothetical protein